MAHETFDPLAAAAFVARRRQQLAEAGVTVAVRHDFARLREVAGQPISRLFGAAGFDYLPGRAFWVEASDAKGRLVHQQALRLEDLAGGTAAQLLESQFRRLWPETAAGVPPGLDVAPALKRMRGRLVWHGEGWLADAWRGRNLAGVLGELGLGLALIEWRPDFVAALHSDGHARRGFGVQQGYHHVQPLGELWRLAPGWLYSDDWIIWIEGDELVRLVNLDAARSASPHPPPGRS